MLLGLSEYCSPVQVRSRGQLLVSRITVEVDPSTHMDGKRVNQALTAAMPSSRQLEFRVPIFASVSGRGEPAMKMLWCWRCQAEVPMLDDDEFKLVSSLRDTGTEGDRREQMFGPLLREYERITGFCETNPNVIFHHVLSMYGPPCARCGKPLRTPRAKLCGTCMHPRSV